MFNNVIQFMLCIFFFGLVFLAGLSTWHYLDRHKPPDHRIPTQLVSIKCWGPEVSFPDKREVVLDYRFIGAKFHDGHTIQDGVQVRNNIVCHITTGKYPNET